MHKIPVPTYRDVFKNIVHAYVKQYFCDVIFVLPGTQRHKGYKSAPEIHWILYLRNHCYHKDKISNGGNRLMQKKPYIRIRVKF